MMELQQQVQQRYELMDLNSAKKKTALAKITITEKNIICTQHYHNYKDEHDFL